MMVTEKERPQQLAIYDDFPYDSSAATEQPQADAGAIRQAACKALQRGKAKDRRKGRNGAA